MIKSLQSLRGIFAIIVVVYHYYSRSTSVVNAGTCGMVFFFIMSGFALSLHHDVRSLKDFSYGKYLRNRFAKLYPLHLLLTLAMACYLGVDCKFWVNVFLLQSWFTDKTMWFSYNGPSWFMSSLVFCYLFYSLFNYWSYKLKPVVMLSALTVATVMLMVSYYFISPDIRHWFFYLFPPARLIPFGLGVVLARFCRGDLMRGSACVWNWLSIGAFVLVIAIILSPRTDVLPWEYFLSVVWLIPLAFLIVALSQAEQKGSIVTRILSWKPLAWLGDISFEIYMWQVLVSIIVGKLAVLMVGHQFLPEVNIVVILALLIPIAWATHRYFTIPVAKRLRVH